MSDPVIIIAACFLSTVLGVLLTRQVMGDDSAIGDKGLGPETLYCILIAMAKMAAFYFVIRLTHNQNLHSMRAVYVAAGLVTAFLQKATHLEATPGEVALVTVVDLGFLIGLIWACLRFL